MKLVERSGRRDRPAVHGRGLPIEDDNTPSLSMCTLVVDGQLFCLDSDRIREVLGERRLAPVPLAPAFLAGVVPYRGEVLTTVNFRALLGLGGFDGPGCVLVLEPKSPTGEVGEPFGLLVDRVGGVVVLDRESLAPNPATFDERSRSLFCGAFPLPDGLLVRLNPDLLEPERLAASPFFRQRGSAGATVALGARGAGSSPGSTAGERENQ